MKGRVYREMDTGEIIYKEEAWEYVIEKFIEASTKGNDENLSEEFERDYKEELTKWFFGGNYIEEEIEAKDSNIFEMIEEECRLETKKEMEVSKC